MWLDDLQRERGRDGAIEGVAAFLEKRTPKWGTS